jgi:hypothetical protein
MRPVMLKRKFVGMRGAFAVRPASYLAALGLRFASLCLAAGPPERAIIAFLQDTPAPPTNVCVVTANVALMERVNDYLFRHLRRASVSEMDRKAVRQRPLPGGRPEQ